jgi:hypothetical protein
MPFALYIVKLPSMPGDAQNRTMRAKKAESMIRPEKNSAPLFS